MTVAAEDDDIGRMVADDIKESLPLARQVVPFFPAMVEGEHLDAADQKTKFGRFLQFVDQPLPLFLAEHGAFAFCVREVATNRLARLGPGGFQFLRGHLAERSAEPTCVEQNDLHPFAFGPENLRVVDPAALPQWRVFRCGEKFHEGFLRRSLAFKFHPGIVFAVIVVVPSADDRNRGAQRSEAGNFGQLCVTRPQHYRVCRVGVDIVSGKDEQLGFQLVDRVPNGLRTVFVGAGPEGDAGEGFLRRHRKGGQKSEDGGEEGAHGDER